MATSDDPTVAVTADTETSGSAAWDQKIRTFERICEGQVSSAGNRLELLVGVASDKAAKRLGDETLTPYEDIAKLFETVPKAILREAVASLRDKQATSPAPVVPAVVSSAVSSFMPAMLPTVPDDTSLLEKLGTFAGPKVDATDIVAAVRVKLTDHLGLDNIEQQLADKIEERALMMGDQVPPIWDELEMARTHYAHADVLKALGKPGNLISAARKKELLRRTDGIFERLREYQGRLTSWQEDWMKRLSNPGALMAGIASLMGGTGNPAAASLNEAPDPGPVLSATEGLIESFNGMFAGNGRAVSRGMAADSISRRAVLDRADLPLAIGATSREEMLRTLGIGVTSDLIRAERDVVQYIVAIMHLLQMNSQQLPGYIIAVQQLGQNIPWDSLMNKTDKGNSRASKGKSSDTFPGSGDTTPSRW